MSADEQTLGEEIIRWIEATCRVPEGALVDQPIRLTGRRTRIRTIYDNSHGTCIISVGRKSGKNCFAACLLLVHLAGSGSDPELAAFSAALSRDQASLLHALGRQNRTNEHHCLQRRHQTTGVPSDVSAVKKRPALQMMREPEDTD